MHKERDKLNIANLMKESEENMIPKSSEISLNRQRVCVKTRKEKSVVVVFVVERKCEILGFGFERKRGFT